MEKEVYRGKFIRVTEEVISGTIWERAYVPSGVIIYPITEDGRILLIKEKRPHERPNVRVKAVAGILEPERGSPEENAQLEMQEEIGFKATKLELLMKTRGSGTVNSEQYFFKATGLIPSKLPNPDGEDCILEILRVTPSEARAMLRNDEIPWSLSTLGLLRVLETEFPAS